MPTPSPLDLNAEEVVLAGVVLGNRIFPLCPAPATMTAPQENRLASLRRVLLTEMLLGTQKEVCAAVSRLADFYATTAVPAERAALDDYKAMCGGIPEAVQALPERLQGLFPNLRCG